MMESILNEDNLSIDLNDLKEQVDFPLIVFVFLVSVRF